METVDRTLLVGNCFALLLHDPAQHRCVRLVGRGLGTWHVADQLGEASKMKIAPTCRRSADVDHRIGQMEGSCCVHALEMSLCGEIKQVP